MKAFNPKDFFKSPLGKLIILVLVMIGCWIVLCVYLSANSPGGTWFPTDAQMNRALKDIKDARIKYKTASEEMAEIEKLREKYNDKLATFWQVERDGDPAVKLRSLLSDTAAVLDITMTRLDNVRISNKITEELTYADLSFQFTDTYDKIISFIKEIETSQPRIGWRSITINAERSRNMMRDPRVTRVATSSGTTTTEQQKYRIDATVRVIRYMPVVSETDAANTKNGTAAGTKAATAAGTAATANQTSQIPPPAAKPTPTAAEAAASRANTPTAVNPTTPVNSAPTAQGGMMPGMNMQGGFGGMQGGMMPGMNMQGGFGGMQGGFGGMQGGMGGMQGGFGGMQGGMGGMQGGMTTGAVNQGFAVPANTATQVQPATPGAAANTTATPVAPRQGAVPAGN